MNFIMMWVVVVNASGFNSSPIISTPYADFESCLRVKIAVQGTTRGDYRSATCVEVKVAVPK